MAAPKAFVHDNIFLRIRESKDALADIWFLHGFGESGLSFYEAFSEASLKDYNLFVPDFPGAGVSPPLPEALDIPLLKSKLEKLIRELSKDRPLIIIAHSLGGLPGTRLCASFGSQVKFYVNIEGNLTSSDAFFSGQATKFDNAEDFYKLFTGKVFEKTAGSGSFQRYFASNQFADPQTLWSLGKSGAALSDSSIAGKEYSRLDCPKIYVYGKTISEKTKRFIETEKLKTLFLKDSGHWPMVDDANFYKQLAHNIKIVF